MRASRRPPDGLIDPLAAACLAALAVAALALSSEASAVAVGASVAICLPVALRSRSPIAAGLLLAAAAVAWPLADATFPAALYAALALVTFSLGSIAALRLAGPVALVALLALEATVGVADDAYVPLALVAAAGFWIGRQSGARRRLTAEIEARNRDIDAEQREFERLAVRRERARIAGELHDIVSHHLSMVVVQAGAGRMAPDGDPVTSRQRFEAIRQGGEQALAELANLVDVLEAEPVDSPAAALLGLTETARETGMAITLRPAALDRLPDDVASVAHRVLQEGLTNALKHGIAVSGELSIECAPGELRVELRNQIAEGSSLAATGSGSGLDGMRERVVAIGGAIEAGADSGSGWRLRVTLPIADPGEVQPADGYLAGMS